MFGWLRRLLSAKAATEEKAADLSVDELRARVDGLSHEAGLSGTNEAFRLLNQGELDGTSLEVELKMLRFLEGRTKERKERDPELVP